MNMQAERVSPPDVGNDSKIRNSKSTGAIKQKRQRDNQADVEKRILMLLTGKSKDDVKKIYKQGITCARRIEEEVRKLKKQNQELNDELCDFRSAADKMKSDRAKLEKDQELFTIEKEHFLIKEARYLKETTSNYYGSLNPPLRNISDITLTDNKSVSSLFQDAECSSAESTATVPESGAILDNLPQIHQSMLVSAPHAYPILTSSIHLTSTTSSSAFTGNDLNTPGNPGIQQETHESASDRTTGFSQESSDYSNSSQSFFGSQTVSISLKDFKENSKADGIYQNGFDLDDLFPDLPPEDSYDFS